MPISHSDILRTPTVTTDICLIRDDANVKALRIGPRVELQQLSENLVNIVMLSQGDDQNTLEPTETNTAESAHGTSRAPHSSRSTPPSAALVPIARY